MSQTPENRSPEDWPPNIEVKADSILTQPGENLVEKVQSERQRGFCMIGIERYKTGHNVGSLWRSASLYEAALIFTVGRPYGTKKDALNADTLKTPRHIPLQHFDSPEDLKKHLPHSTVLVGVELDVRATWIHEFKHPERACYVLGSEDNGLSREMTDACHVLIKLPGRMSMNVACAGTVVMHDRWHKRMVRG